MGERNAPPRPEGDAREAGRSDGGRAAPDLLSASSHGAGGRADAWPGLSGSLESGTHLLPVRVYYEDTDFSGLVYHAGYLRFLERGRTDYLRLAGIDQSALHAGGDGIVFVVRRMTVDYLKPARMDDVVVVETRVADLRGASLVMAQRILRGTAPLVTAEVRVAALGQGRPARIPEALRRRLAGS